MSLVRDLAQRVLADFGTGVDGAILTRSVVIVPVGDQRADLKRDVAVRLIGDDGGVVPVGHKHTFTDLGGHYLVTERGKRCVLNVLEMAVALWMDRTYVAIAAEFVFSVRTPDRFLVAGQSNHPTDGWIERGDEQAVVPSRVNADDGRRPRTHRFRLSPATLVTWPDPDRGNILC